MCGGIPSCQPTEKKKQDPEKQDAIPVENKAEDKKGKLPDYAKTVFEKGYSVEQLAEFLVEKRLLRDGKLIDSISEKSVSQLNNGIGNVLRGMQEMFPEVEA